MTKTERKNERVELATQLGAEEFARMAPPTITTVRATVVEQAQARAADVGIERHVRHDDFQFAFVSALMREWDKARDALPEVRAWNADSRFRSRLTHLRESLGHHLPDFTTQLATNALHAFEYCDNAIKAAAIVDVAERVRLMYVYETEDAGRDSINALEVVAVTVRREVMRGARSGSHSTSAVSNMVAECKLSAYAEVLEIIERVLEA